MSKTIDEKVVEMKFDNKQFESGVQTSMSTIDKLKQKLNFTGASKGLENIGSAAKGISLSGLSGAVETVHSKFSALEVIGVTALANITNSAVNAGKRIVAALTIDPVKSGFQEYETQINAVQTILANTSSKGTTLDNVNEALDELNHYADKTIYNFTEMTRNIGTFTAAGIDLDTSVNAIQGIANLAAVSGSTSQQASTAMYQLSQALATGTVKLMDWNSVVNAGMGGEIFQNALKKTSKELNTGAEAAIEANGSFRESLSTGWLTSEVLTKTLKKFTESGATEYVAEYTGLTSKAVSAALESAEAQYGEADAIDKASEALAKKSGKSKDEIKSVLDMAKTSEDAATKVKTFSQLIDTTKEAVQSGWTQTWETIIGDFNQAKTLWTNVSDVMNNAIGKISDWRNNIIEGAMGSPFGKAIEGVSAFKNSIDDVSKTTKEYKDLVSEIINGEWGNGQDRVDKLTKAGYDYAHAQNLVNEKLGVSFRHTTKFTEAQKDSNKTQGETLEMYAKMSDAKLKDLGYSKDEIESLRHIEKEANKAGISMSDFVDSVSNQKTGRELIIESFSNSFKGFKKVLSSVKKAWQEIFPPKSAEEKAQGIYKVIQKINEFSKKMVMSDETADKLKRTFKGLFAIVKLITTVAGGAFSIAFKIAKAILGAFNLDILDATAYIGDAVVKIQEWISSHNFLTKAIKFCIPYIKSAVSFVKQWIDVLKNSGVFQNFISYVKDAATAFKNWFAGMKEADNIPKYILSGLANGIKNGAGIVFDAVISLGKTILSKIKEVLGIHSPSKEFFDIGKNIIQGLFNGIQNGASTVWELLKTIGSKCIKVIADIGFDRIFGVAMGAGILITTNKLANAFENFSEVFSGAGKMMEGVGKAFNGLGKSLAANAWEKKSKAVLNIAIAIAILAGSIYLLSTIDTGKMWSSIGAIAALGAIIVGLSVAATKLTGTVSVFQKSMTPVLSIAAAILILAIAMSKISKMSDGDLDRGLSIIGKLLLMLTGVMAISKLAGKNGASAGTMLLKMSGSILILIHAIKVLSKMKDSDISKGISFIKKVGGMFAILIAVSLLAGKNATKAGGMLIKASLSLLILVGVVKAVAKMKDSDISKGISFIKKVGGMFAILIAVSLLAGKNATKAGGMLIMMSGAFLILTYTMKIIAGMSANDITKGLTVIKTIGLIFAALIVVSKLAGDNAAKAGGMLIAMSASLLILVGVIYLISKMDPKDVKRGLTVVTILEGLFAALLVASRNADGSSKSIIAITACIALLIGSVAALTLLNPQKLETATKSISLLMGMFSLLIFSTGNLKNTDGTMQTLYSLVGVVACLAGVLGLMAALDVEASMPNATAIGILLAAMSASLLILSEAKEVSDKNINALIKMGIVVAEVAVILGVMASIGNGITASIQTATAIGILLNAMATSMLIVSTITNVNDKAINCLIKMGVVVGEVAVILGLLGYLSSLGGGFEVSIGAATAIGILLNAMASSLLILDHVGSVSDSAIIAIGKLGLVLDGLILAFAGVIAIMGYLNQIDGVSEALDSGIEVMRKIGSAIGTFVGNLIGSAAEGIFGSLPQIGTDLSNFMANLNPFITGIQGIDTSSMAGGKALAELILLLTAADLLNGITNFLGLSEGNPLENFAAQLVPFGTAMVSFSNTVSGNVDSKAVEAAANAGKMMSSFGNTIPNTGGWLAGLVGDNTMDEFGAQMVSFGKSVVSFSNTVSGNVDSKAVEAAANAGKMMSSFGNTIPNTGGWLAGLVGDNTMDEFGAQMVSFGKSVVAFADALDEGTIDTDKVEAAANAGKMMSAMAVTLPNTGGLLGFITGNNDMDDFGSQMEAFGESIVSFSNTLTANGGIDSDAIAAAASAGSMMSSLANSLPNGTSGLDWLLGDDQVDLDEFGTQLSSFGVAMKDFSDSVTGIRSADMSNVIGCVNVLTNMNSSLETIGDTCDWFESSDNDFETMGVNLEKFGVALIKGSNKGSDIHTSYVKNFVDAVISMSKLNSNLTAIKNIVSWMSSETGLSKLEEGFDDIGMAINSYANSTAGIDVGALAESTTQFVRIAKMVNDISGMDSTAFGTFGETLGTIGKSGVDNFISAFSGASDRASKAISQLINDMLKTVKAKESTFTTYGKGTMIKFVSGVTNYKRSISSSFIGVLNGCISTIRNYYFKFYSAGAYMAQGFANGISSKSYIVKAKAKAMAEAAINAANRTLDINSPSKVFYETGAYAGQGFVNALGDYASKAYNASSNMAESARTGLSKSIAKVSDVMNSDMDTQPTIRPVIDLSDVQSGANAINGILDFGPSVGILSNVGSINAAMNRRSQNGANDDVISAIDKLNSKLDNVGGTSYSINGITYDDGSNITDAVKTLVRAARVERRV